METRYIASFKMRPDILVQYLDGCEGIAILPTAEQAIRCVILCQSLTNTFTPIFVVRLDERTGNLFLLAGDNIQIEIYPNGLWRFL